MLVRSQKNPPKSPRETPFPPVTHPPPHHLKSKPSVLLASSPLGLILQRRAENHLQQVLLHNLAASKSRTSQKHFLQYQHHYYQKVLRDRDERLSTFMEGRSVRWRDIERERMSARSKLVQRVRNQEERRGKEASEHYKREQEKLQSAASLRKSSFCYTVSERSRSSTIRRQKEEKEKGFAERVFKGIMEKGKRIAKNLSEFTERRKQKEKQRQLRMTEVYNKKNKNCEQFKQNSLVNLMSGIGRSQVKLQEMQTIEKSLIAKRSRHQTQSLHKVLSKKQEALKARQQKILREINFKNQKIQKTNEEQNKGGRLNTLKYSSQHFMEVLRKGKDIKQRENQRAQQRTLKKMNRFQQINVFKEESERIRQMLITEKYTTHR